MSTSLATAWRYRQAGRRLGYPLQVGFAVNNNCNTFCEMCNIWKIMPKEALSLDEIGAIFGGGLFRHCVTVSLTGGEPTLRRDFAQIPLTLAEAMPSLRSLNLTSNGFASEKIEEDLAGFLPELRRRGVRFAVNLSIDGVGEVHDRIRGNPRAFECLEDTIDRLKRLRARQRFRLVLAFTLTRSNVQDARNVLAYAKRRDLYVIFRDAFTIQRIGNLDSFDDFSLTDEDLRETSRLYRELLADYDASHSRSLYYRMLLRMKAGGERDIPCLYRKAGLFVDHRADLYVCTVFSRKIGNALTDDAERAYFESRAHRDELAASDCRGCSHDVTLYTPFGRQLWDRLKSRATGIAR